LNRSDDISLYETLLRDGFNLIAKALADMDKFWLILSFEFGLVKDLAGNNSLSHG